MNNLSQIKKYLSHQFVWVNLLAFVLPLLFKLTPTFIMFFAVVVVAQSKFKIYKYQVKNKVWLFSILYLFYIIGAFYTQHTNELKSELEVKLALLIFPILFLITKPLPKVVMNKVLLNFVLGCFINTIVSIFKAWSCFEAKGIVECFYSSRLAFSFHPSYLALYLNLAVAILLYFDLHKLRPYHITRWMIWVLIVVFSVFLVLLSSKMGIIGLFLVLLIFFVYHLRQVSWKRTIIKSLAPVVVFSVFLVLAPVTQTRFKNMANVVKQHTGEEQINVEKIESNAARIHIWGIALKLVKQNFLLGLGTGDVTNALVEEYQEKGMIQAAEKRLNAHNQFFETFLAIGFFGFSTLVSFLIIGLYMAIKYKSFIYLIYIILCTAHFSVESMLETQAGVVFFAFFNCLLFVQLNHVQSNESNNHSRS